MDNVVDEKTRARLSDLGWRLEQWPDGVPCACDAETGALRVSDRWPEDRRAGSVFRVFEIIGEWPDFASAVAAARYAYGKRAAPVTRAQKDVLAEREKQRAKWGDMHDDDHDDGVLADVASYLASNGSRPPPTDWSEDLWRRHDRRGRLVIAGALILAEIEREDRESARGPMRPRRA